LGDHSYHHGEVTGGKVPLRSIKWKISIHDYVHNDLDYDINNARVFTEEEVRKLMVPSISEYVEEETLVVQRFSFGSRVYHVCRDLVFTLGTRIYKTVSFAQLQQKAVPSTHEYCMNGCSSTLQRFQPHPHTSE
jgi:hypothetical protein